jgi:hypothetical protein
VRLVKVETRDAAWSGVAARDDGGETAGDVLRRSAVLLSGDFASFLLFAAVGRSSHGEALLFLDVLSTAGPFLLSWLAIAPLAGAYGEAARMGDLRTALPPALRALALSVPGGLALRCLSQGGRLPPIPFVVITLAVTGSLLLAWRTGATLAGPKKAFFASRAQKNRAGGPLEFFSLLQGLTKRW